MYQIEVRNEKLHKYRLIRGQDPHVVKQKAAVQLAQWKAMEQRVRAAEERQAERMRRARDREAKVAAAAEATAEAEAALDELHKLLANTLGRDDALDWESLKDRRPFHIPRPTPLPPPEPPTSSVPPREPQARDPEYNPRITLWDKLFPHRWQAKLDDAAARFRADRERWKRDAATFEQERCRRRAAYEAAKREWQQRESARVQQWEEAKAKYERDQKERNAAVDCLRAAYERAERHAVEEYCELVLTRSPYPDAFPKAFNLTYHEKARALYVDYTLPGPSNLPRLKEVKYVRARDELQEVYLPERAFNTLYENVLYQVVVRTLHELFEADRIRALEKVVLNGYVRTCNPATGHEELRCILTVNAPREPVEHANLANIDPRAFFERLAGKTGGRLSALVSIEPAAAPADHEPTVPLPVEDTTQEVDLSGLGD